MTDMAIGEKYAPLGKWLKEHVGDSVKLTFDELNQIIPIPNHAYKNRPSWANLSNPASFCSSWISAGYVVDSISLEDQWVVFRKGEVQGHTHHSKPPYRVVDQKKLAEAIQAGYECYDSMKDDPHHRYLSWEYCHEAFRLNRRPQIDATIDYLCLHLAWYLASWGMLIGLWSQPVLRKRSWMRNISGSARAMNRPLMNGQLIATIGDGSCVRFAAELSRKRRCPITVAREVQTRESVPIVHEMVVANPHSWLDIIRMMVYY